MWVVIQEHVRTTRRGGEIRGDRHGHTDEQEIRGWKIQSLFVRTRQQGHQHVLPR